LLRVLDFTPTTAEALRPATYTEGLEVVYQTPAEEFALSRLTALDGLYLSRPLRPSDIRVDPDVQRFMAGVRAAAS
ncbi:MAG: hypothetical protein J0I62_02920, partial [Microbacterium sp.]|nr:hypothetical protein [Microbacterium sp.]